MAVRDLTTDEAESLGFDFENPDSEAIWHIDVGTMAGSYAPDLVVKKVEGGWLWHSAGQLQLCDTEAEAKALFEHDLVELTRACVDPSADNEFLWEAGDTFLASVGYEENGEGAHCVTRVDGELDWSTHSTCAEALEAVVDLALDLPYEAVPADQRSPLAARLSEIQVRLALNFDDGLVTFCERFSPKEDNVWYTDDDDSEGLALAKVGEWWALANATRYSPGSFDLYETFEEGRTALARGVAECDHDAEYDTYTWTSLDKADLVLAVRIDADEDTYAVIAAFGDRTSELRTVVGENEAATQAAAILARHFEQLPPATDTDSAETRVQYLALRRRILQDAAAGCEASLGDAIREADAENVYGRGRKLTWVDVAAGLGVHRDTLQEIRNGNAWT